MVISVFRFDFSARKLGLINSKRPAELEFPDNRLSKLVGLQKVLRKSSGNPKNSGLKLSEGLLL